jgi:hypothetical protein
MLLAARDPHWLYAHWDLTPSQQRQYNALSADRHLVVRVYPGAVVERPAREVHVHPESRHWFIHVEHAETQYVAELGYYQPGRQWLSLAFSPPTVTPAEAVSTDQTVRFVTIPVHVPLSQLAALAKQTVPVDLPPMEAAREHALAELVGLHLVQQEGISSAEVGEVVPGRSEGEVAAGESVAELILYGATEPDASVTIGGRPIQLRPDGTFSCRFALPDGEHVVSLSALSARDDLRQAELRFSRHTDYQGEGSAAPQDQSLEPIEAESP